MKDTDFFNQELIKNHLLFSIYDVDEFVLREVEGIKSSNALDIWDVRKAKRYSFEVIHVGEGECEEIELSNEEYLNIKEIGASNCFTRLNYEEFQDNFPLDEFEHWYSDDWLINFQYNKAFLPSVIEWIEETEGDKSKRLRIRKIIRKLKQSQKSLENIKFGWHSDIPLNEIQKAVIQIFLRFDNLMFDGLKTHFIDFFPELFAEKKFGNEGVSKNDIINSLINETSKNLFDSYEDKLVSQKFLSEDRKQWLKGSADLVRFYNYCERKGMINRAYVNKSKGMKFLRMLYNFYENDSIDSSQKKRLKQDEGCIGQFNFLDIL